MSALDWSQYTAVESIPGKVSGAWVLKKYADAGIGDIVECFDGLVCEQVKSVLEFAARSLNSRL